MTHAQKMALFEAHEACLARIAGPRTKGTMELALAVGDFLALVTQRYPEWTPALPLSFSARKRMVR